MNLPAILLDETSDVNSLTDELGHIPSQLRDAARRGDETALAALSDRRSQLPELIQTAKLRDFAARLSVARSRLGAIDSELQNAYLEAMKAATKMETDVPVLEATIERLRSAAAQAHHERDTLQFAAKQARETLTQIQSEREALLLAQFD
jgi:chromosome segregation ATPase